MTYQEICRKLTAAGIESPQWDAQLLIGHFCKRDRLAILAAPDEELISEELHRAVERRCQREPLQYIVGTWAFYRQEYEVSPACLIPRSDTEILVEEAIKRLPQNAFFADLCTGSGCIAVSVLAERKDTHALAVDLSCDALELAERNASRNGVAPRFTPKHADVLQLSDEWMEQFPRPHAILSNPPYIRQSVLQTLSPEVGFEPQMALDGGEDGLIFYRALMEIAAKWLQPDGFCLFEIGFDQGDALRAMALENGFSCRIQKDLGGCDRVAILHPNHIG